jgi:hypothetical protein
VPRYTHEDGAGARFEAFWLYTFLSEPPQVLTLPTAGCCCRPRSVRASCYAAYSPRGELAGEQKNGRVLRPIMRWRWQCPPPRFEGFSLEGDVVFALFAGVNRRLSN